MPKSSVKPSDVTEAAAAPDETALAEIEGTTAVATLQPGSMSGEISSSDLSLPRLTLVHPISKLANEHKPGSHLLGDSELLHGVGGTAEIIIVQFRKVFEETLPFGADVIPAIFETSEEFKAAGYENRYGAEKAVHERADIVLLAKKPEDASEVNFPIAVGGAMWAPAMWTLRKSSYSTAAKEIISKNGITLSATGLTGGKWELRSSFEKRGNNEIWVPRVKLTGLTTPEERAEILSALGGVQ